MELRISELGFEVSLTILPVNDLYIHEETIPSSLRLLIADLSRVGHLKDPVIVDENSNVVLDGMHRVAAVKALNLNFIPVCLVDYNDPRVKVHAWWRIIQGSEDKFKFFLEASPFLSNPLPKEKLNDYINAYPLLVFSNGFYVFKSRDLFESFSLVKNIEFHMSSSGFKVNYIPEFEAMDALNSGRCIGVISFPPISKRDVVMLAKSGRLLPHKSTRHVLPYRPVNLKVPLKILKMHDLCEARILFMEFLKDRRGRLIPPGIFKGRRYEEYLYFFEEV
ncbi:MAG: ParB N-terminal domain-containing protein [Candidatus Verstraetearchaeota archaeon]|nr:ParB N-terminal domain-containing protein [Candidatus Verstraetearchaeota archaeon]